MESPGRARPGRAKFVTAAVVGVGAWLTEASAAGIPAHAAGVGACADSVEDILNIALTMEQLLVTFYYTGLTSPGVMRSPLLGGASGDPNNPGLPPNGNPQHVRFLQAALDAQAKHAALLIVYGATAQHKSFYFPPTTFTRPGTVADPASFLGLLGKLEAASLAMYIAASTQFSMHRRADLAALATQMMGVEAEHRTLGRILEGVIPPNNLTLENASFSCVSELNIVLRPFLTGRRFLFASDATTATPLPGQTQITRVVGKYGTHRLRRFV